MRQAFLANRVTISARGTLATALLAVASVALSSCHLFDFLDNHSTGAKIAWHISGKAIGTPAFDGTTAFFNTGDHHIVALDAATGAERWRAPTGSTEGPPLGPSCVVVAELVACGDEDVVAFHRQDGSLAWRYHATRGYGPGHFPITAHNGVIFAGSNSIGPLGTGIMYALDAASGTPLWVAGPLADDTNGVNISQLSADDDIVVGAFIRGTRKITGGVVALDAKTGAVRWITNFPQASPDSTSGGVSTALWESSVVGSSTDGKIYVLDRVTGAVESFFPGVGREANVNGLTSVVTFDLRAIVVSGSTVFADSFGNWLIAYDLRQHRELWRTVAPEGSSNASPIVVDGDAVYVVNFSGHLVAFSTTGPKVLWDIGTFEDAFVATAAVGPERLFVSGLTGFWAIQK